MWIHIFCCKLFPNNWNMAPVLGKLDHPPAYFQSSIILFLNISILLISSTIIWQQLLTIWAGMVEKLKNLFFSKNI